MQKVLIAGATGYLGRYVVKEFKKQGYWVRALARDKAKLEDLSLYIDEVVEGEVTDPNSISGICNDIDIVFSSVGITKQKDNVTFMDVDYQANMNILGDAVNENVSQFIYVSIFNAEKIRHLKSVEAKLKFAEALKESGIHYTIVNPNGFFSDMLEYLEMAQKGKGYLFGDGNYKINPIHGEDLAEFCVNAADSNENELDVGGPEIFTHIEIMQIAFEVLKGKLKITRIPLWIRDIILKIMRVFTPIKTYGPVEFFMTVLAMDMVAPQYGNHKLNEYFIENINQIRS